MAAPWDNPKEKEKDKTFVACTEKYEKEYEIHKFEHNAKQKVKKAIEKCCKEIPAPHPREKFEECMKKYLKN
ncbi:hypothetical protein C3L23_06090 [Nautilia sp. PV-1]|uniref:hypothetical protein n=1 Tax=Nautilia sp. PV-1 TaxID=2579250 RepID=UPI000FD6E37A|nr:hypothetical protein [Nautilia sp. PV-1]AZV46856.1 hypothetical protein C3L23_06090 [Nautilia sp. PV-1]